MHNALHALAIHRASIVVPTKILQPHPSLPIHQPSPLARWLRQDSTCLPTHSSLGRNPLSRSSLGRSCGAGTQGRLAPRLPGADHERVGSDARRVLRPKLSRKKSFSLSLRGISLTSMATCLPLLTAPCPWTRPGTVRDMCSPAKKSTSA